MAVVVDYVELARWKVEAPVAKVAVYHVHSVVFKCAVKTRAFKDLAQDTDGVDQVGERTEDGHGREEGRVVVVGEGVGIGDDLSDVLATL